MKRGAKFGFVVLLSLAGLATQSAKAGSAVAMENRHGHLVSLHGFSAEESKRRALELAHRLYGPNVRILAATDVSGYCAIAVARRGDRAVIGVSLGRPSAADADRRAIEQCLTSGGTEPRVKWRFTG